MCMQDVDIARQTKTNVYQTTTTQDLPPNAMRLSIRIIITQVEVAQLLALRVPINGTSNSSSVPLAIVAWVQEVATATTDEFELQRDTSLEDVGDVLLGALRISSQNGTIVTAIETYLEVVTPRSIDATKLPK